MGMVNLISLDDYSFITFFFFAFIEIVPNSLKKTHMKLIIVDINVLTKHAIQRAHTAMGIKVCG